MVLLRIIAVLVLFLGQAFSQVEEYELIKYNEFKTDKREVPDQYIGSNKDNHYFIYSKGKYGYGASSIFQFDKEYIPTGKKIELTRNNKDLGIKQYSLGVFKINKKLLNIVVEVTKTSNKYFTQLIDLDEFKISDKKEILNLSFENSENRPYVSFLKSKSDETVGLFYQVSSEGDVVNKEYNLLLFDKEFNKIKESSYNFSKFSDQFMIAKGLLIDEGEMIVLAMEPHKETKGSKKEFKPNYNYKILSLKDEVFTIIGHIPNDKKWLNSLRISVDNSLVKLIGFYSDVDEYSSCGIFFHQIDLANHDYVRHVFTPHDNDLLDKHLQIEPSETGEKKKVKKYGELSYYAINNVFSLETGSSLICAEQSYNIYDTYHTDYNRKNILLICLDSRGKTLWEEVIKKDNSKAGTWLYSSYIVLKDKEDFIFIYNDNLDNLKLNDPIRYPTFSGDLYESIIVARLKVDGTVIQKEVASRSDLKGYRMRPNLSFRLKENSILLFAQKPSNVKNQRFIELKY